MIRRFRKNSIFITITAVLLLLSLAMMGVYGYFINRTMEHNHQDQIHRGNFSLLRQTGDTVDLTVQFLEQSMGQLLWDEELVRYALVPFSENDNLEYSILGKLKNAAQSQAMVSDIWFYSPVSNMVFTAQGARHRLVDFPDMQVLQRHQDRDRARRALSRDLYADLFAWQDRLFIAVDLVLAGPVSTLVFEVNTARLYQALGSQRPGDLYLFDAAGVPVGGAWYAQTGQRWADLKDGALFYREGDGAPPASARWYRCQSSATGWTFLMEVDRTGWSLSPAEAASVLAPSWIFFLLLGLLGAAVVTRQIYRPINQMIHLALGATSPGGQLAGWDQAKNELDYLKLTYQDTVHHNIQMKQALSRLTGDVVEQTIRSLILGKEVSPAYLKELFDTLDTPLQPDCRCAALVCRRIPGEDGELPIREGNLYYLSIYQATASEQRDGLTMICTQMAPGVVGVVLCFPADTDPMEIRQRVAQTKLRIEGHLQRLSCPSVVERGGIYPCLTDVGRSYQEADRAASYTLYLTHSGEAAFHEGASPQAERTEHYTEQLQTLLSLAEGDDLPTAQRLLDQILSDMEAEPGPLEGRAARCEWLEDQLTERMLSYSGDVDAGTRAAWPPPAPADGNSFGAARARCVQLLEQIGAYSGKSQYRYVAEAKRYLDLHYADSSLTAGTVSDYLGIHVVYFGSLFNEQTRESFPAYLSRVRVEHAKDILTMTRIPVKDVGFKCGFNTVQTFNRAFKKYTQLTPSQFREQTHRRTD